MDDVRLQQIKAMLRAVLQSTKEGVTEDRIMGEYRGMTGQKIPYESFGYSSLHAFLETLTDVVRFGSNKQGERTLFAIADESTAHIQRMVAAQKGKSRKRSRPTKAVYRRSVKSYSFTSSGARKPVFPAAASASYGRSQARPVARVPPQASRTGMAITVNRSETRSVSVSKPKSDIQITNSKSKPQSSSSVSGASDNIVFGKNFEVPPRFRRCSDAQSKDDTSVVDDVDRLDFTGGSSPSPDYKSKLHTYCSKKKIGPLLYETLPVGKSGGFVCTLKIKSEHFGSQGIYRTKKDAEHAASKVAIEKLLANQDQRLDSRKDESQDVPDDDMKQRISELVTRRPNGIWDQRLIVEYKENYGQKIPSNIMEKLQKWPDIVTVECVKGTEMKILYPVKKSAHRLVQSRSTPEKSLKIAPTELPLGSKQLRVFVTSVEDCDEFYVQLYDSCIGSIAEKLAEVYESRGRPMELQLFAIGEYCAAQYVDKDWYRAEIRKVEQSSDKSKVQVFYTDFGNYDVIPSSQIRRLLENFYKEKAQAVRCCLQDVFLKDEVDRKDFVEAFKDIVTDEEGVEFYIDVIGKQEESYSVVLYKHTKGDVFSVNTYLVKQHLASSHPIIPDPSPIQLPRDKFWDVYISCIYSTAQINIRLVGPDYSDELEKLEQAMEGTYGSGKSQTLTAEDIEEGQVYAAYDDEVWFRIRVQSISGNEVEVHCLDHDDYSTIDVSQLHRMKPRHNVLPYQAVSCQLHGLESLADNENVTQKLCELALDKICIAEVRSKEDSEHISIVLYDTSGENDLNINEAIVQDEDLKPALPNLDTNVDVYVSHVAEEGSVFVQIPGSGLARLESLMEDISEYYQSKKVQAEEFVSCAEPGRLCCARFGEDSWGRAEVCELLPGRQVEIKYVDFGIHEVLPLSGLREFTKSNLHLQTLPFQAVECELTGLPPSGKLWSKQGISRLQELVSREQLYTVQVDSPGDGDSLPRISIYIEEDGGRLTWFNEKLLEETENFVSQEKLNNLKEELFDEVESTSQESAQHQNSGSVTNQQSENYTSPVALSSRDAEVSSQCSAAVSGSFKDVAMLPLPELVEIPPEGEYFDVHITHVVDPGNFVVIPFESKDELQQLLVDMFKYYHETVVDMATMCEGDVVAACNEDGVWYRAEIKAILGSEGSEVVNVYFLDYGDYNIVSMNDIKPLVNQFRKLPLQAVRAKLAGASPVLTTGWSQKCKERFSQLVLEKDLVALICKHKDCLSLILTDTSQENQDFVIGDVLLSENLAVIQAIH